MSSRSQGGPGSAESLKDVSTHFEFGRNWSDYSRLVDEARISGATTALERLLTADALEGRTFLDIGCGSGLHSLAALRLGASRLLATDIDPISVETTRRVVSDNAPNTTWAAEIRSVFDLNPADLGQFDIVYSWGVLHHTGAMYEAVTSASKMVSAGGTFVIALYRKTRFCGFWRVEKRFYARAPKLVQRGLRAMFVTAFGIATRLRGGNLREYQATYAERGMDFRHDVHDWLGGYPYESISPPEVHRFLGSLGFELIREFTKPAGSGVLGSGCDEYVFRRT
jgi:SAM-dependent methyltransferase